MIQQKWLHILFLSVVCLVLAWVFVITLGRYSWDPTVTILDAGQGDATLIQTTQGHAILIDGGPGRGIIAELGDVLPPWRRSLDAILLTHPDADHLSGVVAVIEQYKIGWIGLTGIVDESELYRSFLVLLEEKEIPVVLLERGDQIQAGEDIFLTVLSPEGLLGVDPGNVNATSLVVVLTDKRGQHRMLLMGDAERDVEYALLSENLVPGVDFLRIGHHGSRFGTSNAFLLATNPEYAIVSVGKKNRYGHPSLSVLERLAKAGSVILNTAKEGTMTFVLNKEYQY